MAGCLLALLRGQHAARCTITAAPAAAAVVTPVVMTPGTARPGPDVVTAVVLVVCDARAAVGAGLARGVEQSLILLLVHMGGPELATAHAAVVRNRAGRAERHITMRTDQQGADAAF